MRDSKTLDEITAAIASAFPQGLARELKDNLRASVQSTLDRLDLVTREELEVQEAVLQRTRRQLQELERRIAELESRLLKK